MISYDAINTPRLALSRNHRAASFQWERFRLRATRASRDLTLVRLSADQPINGAMDERFQGYWLGGGLMACLDSRMDPAVHDVRLDSRWYTVKQRSYGLEALLECLECG